MNWPRPTTMTKARSFRGMASYYRRVIEGFSKQALPITKMIHKNTKFEWSEEYEQSFQELKKRIVLALVLAILEGTNGFIIYNDASKKGLGCVLM